MKTITAQELQEKMDDVVLVDVLTEESYGKQHLPGARNIPVPEIEERAPQELPDKDAPIVVYCASAECQASPKAARTLEEMGYTDVTDFEDGLAGWEAAGYDFE